MALQDKNWLYFKEHRPGIFQKLSAAGEEHCRREKARSGAWTLKFRSGEEWFYLHSKYDPQSESLKWVRQFDFQTDHWVLIGLGLGYHLEKILAQKTRNARVLLIEPDWEIVRHSLHTLDWEKLLGRDDFFCCLGDDLHVLGEIAPNFFNLVLFEKIELVELLPEKRFFAEFFKQARDTVENEIRTLLYDFKTRLAENSMVGKNILKNLHHILRARPVFHLRDFFRDGTGIIVSAGPSLDRNILQLKKVTDRAVIIAVDTALKPLLRRGIQPHFTVAVDPSYKNYLHLQGTEKSAQNFLLAETGISSQVFKDFRDRIFCSTLGKPIFKMLEDVTGPIGTIEAWGSVISMAVNFAIFLGLNPIVFMGQDFAYTNMRNHCRGTSWEDGWLESTRDLDALQRRENLSIGGIKQSREVSDMFGNKILTSDKLILYKNFLLRILHNHPKIAFINATEGGIFSEIDHPSFQWVLDHHIFGKPVIDLQKIHTLPVVEKPGDREKLARFFSAKIDFFQNHLKSLTGFQEQIQAADPADPQTLFSLLEQGEILKNELYTTVQHGEIVEMWSEAPIYEFLRKAERVKKQGINESTVPNLLHLLKEYFTKLIPVIENIIDSFQTARSSIRPH